MRKVQIHADATERTRNNRPRPACVRNEFLFNERKRSHQYASELQFKARAFECCPRDGLIRLPSGRPLCGKLFSLLSEDPISQAQLLDPVHSEPLASDRS